MTYTNPYYTGTSAAESTRRHWQNRVLNEEPLVDRTRQWVESQLVIDPQSTHVAESSRDPPEGRSKGKQPVYDSVDTATEADTSSQHSHSPAKNWVKCTRAGCGMHIYKSQIDQHLAFHDSKTDARNKNPPSTEPSRHKGKGKEKARVDSPPPIPTRPKKICHVCTGEISPGKSYQPFCKHIWCTSCVRSRFKLGLRDRSQWPPTCCPGERFSMHTARKVLTPDIVAEMDRRREELDDPSPKFCCVPNCGTYIGRRNKSDNVGTCPKCRARMCLRCKEPSHSGRGCDDNKNTRKFREFAQREGYKECRCGRMIELKADCNHITCVCGYKFCYVCGAKDWVCDCPAFDAQNLQQRIRQAHAEGEPGVAWLLAQQNGVRNNYVGAQHFQL